MPWQKSLTDAGANKPQSHELVCFCTLSPWKNNRSAIVKYHVTCMIDGHCTDKLLLTMTVPGLPDTIFAQPNPVWVSGYDTYKLTDVSSQGWIHESRSLSSSTTRNFPLRRILHVSLNQLEWLIIISWAARPLKTLGIFFFPLLGF